MFKKLLVPILLLLPFLCLAQSEAGLLKDYAKDVHNMTTPLKWSEKLNIIAVNGEKNQIAVAGIDPDMNETWTTALDGYAISVSKFKGKVLIVTTTNHDRRPDQVVYKGFILDPATGKVVLEKEMYTADQQYIVEPHFFESKDGSFYKMAIRQTNLENKIGFFNFLAPVALFTVPHMMSKQAETSDITVMDFDEKLNPINVFHPAISDDAFITMGCNSLGALYLSWYRHGNVNILKYLPGKKDPIAQVNEEFDIRKGSESYFAFFPSEKNPDILYMTISYKNADKEFALTVSKINFAKNSIQPVDESLTRAHLKELVKAFVPVNKKLDKPYDLIGNFCTVRLLTEQNDRIIVFLSAASVTTYHSPSGGYTVVAEEGSMLIKGYDLDLNPKYDQLLPSGYKINTPFLLNPGIYKTGNNLNIIADYKKDGTLSGAMNISTGEWDSMDLLPKKKLAGDDFPEADNILWYPSGFVIPYTRQRGFTKVNQDISLQQMVF
jgi:hypothetical protein